MVRSRTMAASMVQRSRLSVRGRSVSRSLPSWPSRAWLMVQPRRVGVFITPWPSLAPSNVVARRQEVCERMPAHVHACAVPLGREIPQRWTVKSGHRPPAYPYSHFENNGEKKQLLDDQTWCLFQAGDAIYKTIISDWNFHASALFL